MTREIKVTLDFISIANNRISSTKICDWSPWSPSIKNSFDIWVAIALILYVFKTAIIPLFTLGSPPKVFFLLVFNCTLRNQRVVLNNICPFFKLDFFCFTLLFFIFDLHIYKVYKTLQISHYVAFVTKLNNVSFYTNA